jgi:peptide/nickel transport system substrate-binding protein
MRPAAFLLALLLVASLPAATDAVTLIYLRTTDAINIDPWQAEDLYSNEIASNIFEGLVRFKKNSTAIEPCLATSWSVSPDGRKWRFVLRHGVTFHDGSPFQARSVLESFRGRLGEKAKNRRLNFPAAFITAIRSKDPYSVEFVLDRPYAPFLIALADSSSFIKPAPSGGGKLPHTPIGTGPFRFFSWTRGKSLILIRHANYWARTGNIEKIVFKVMPDSLGRLLQIRNGSADIIAVQSAREFEDVSLRSDIQIIRNPPVSTHYLAFNTRKEPFDRREIRAAFRHIISKENLVRQVFQKLAEPAHSSLPPSIHPDGGSAPEDRFDLQAARALLKKGGLENGFACTLHFPAGQEGIEEIAELVAIYAKKAGILIKKIKLPFAELIEKAGRAEHDLMILGWSSNPDPDFFLYPLFTFSPGHRNRFFYENPDLIRLLDLGKVTRDASARGRIYAQALAILDEDTPWIPLFHQVRTMACRSGISGLGFNPLGQVLFRDALKESSQ